MNAINVRFYYGFCLKAKSFQAFLLILQALLIKIIQYLLHRNAMPNLQFQFHNVNMKGDKRLQLKLEKKLHIQYTYNNWSHQHYFWNFRATHHSIIFVLEWSKFILYSFFTDTLIGDHFKQHIFPRWLPVFTFFHCLKIWKV